MVNINKLKECGFFEMNINQQIEFLRNNNFFDLSNESKIKFLEEIGLFYLYSARARKCRLFKRKAIEC